MSEKVINMLSKGHVDENKRTTSETKRGPVYFTPVDGVRDPRVHADKTQLYSSIKRTLGPRIGYSSAAGGWSDDVVAEHWSLPATKRYDNRPPRHRFVVVVGSAPTFVKWDDDGDVNEGLVEPGTINVMPQGLTSSTSWTSDLNVVSVEFSSALMNRLLDGRDSHGPSEQLVSCRNVPDPIAYDVTHRIMAEMAKPTERLYGEMLCLVLAIHVLRAYGRNRVDALRFKGRMSAARARRVLEYIRANLDGDLAVSALAREAGLSDAHFARAFRATFNEPPHRLVLRWRIERASQLIRHEGVSLADAALSAGFYDQAHFSNAVRRHFGTSPGRLMNGRPEGDGVE